MRNLWSLVLLSFLVTAPLAAEDLKVLPEERDGVAPSQMLHAYLMGKVCAASDRRIAELETIKSPEQMAAYQQRVRRFFIEQIGGLPQRTPLNARVVGAEQRDGYRIEKVIFESQPQHYVTAILYLPQRDPPYPGVLVPCGHSANGKARDLYQRAPILMAKSGMAALCYDPLDQGERHQLLDADGKPIIAQSTHGHNLAGVGAVLVGRNTATYRIWDGMRAIDYLADRPEVDGQRIGCTGISGGGTMTSYLMALDDRIQAAAPGCYLTSYRRLLETIGPQDAEQTIHAQVGYGMDHADFLLMRATKPTLMMTATKDYFDIDGAWHSFRQAKRWYGRLGYAERVEMFEVDSGHGFPPEMRVAAARWMRRWLLHVDDAITESESAVASDQECQCTPRGEVMLLAGARSVYDLNTDLETSLAPQRERYWRETERSVALERVRAICGIRRLSELSKPGLAKVGSTPRDGYRIDKLILRPEPGISLPALLFVPKQATGSATLYLHAEGKHVDASPGGKIEELVRQGQVVLVPDIRGVGETTSKGKHSYGRYLPAVWSDSTIAYLLGKPLLAMRAEDVLICAQFLARHQQVGKPQSGEPQSGEPQSGKPQSGKPQSVNLISVGRLGPAALHAAALEPDLFAEIVLRRSLVSWSNVVRTPLSQNQFVNLVHGALKTYDLPDLGATLGDKLRIVEPLDAAEELVAKKGE